MTTELQRVEAKPHEPEPAREAVDSRPRRLWERWLRPAIYPTFAYLVARALALMAVATTGAIKTRAPLMNLVLVWDGGWYSRIALYGYPGHIPVFHGHAAQSEFAFFPGYPYLMRAMMRVTACDTNFAGLTIAMAGGLITTLIVWVIARQLCGDAVAKRSALLFSFFPGAFVFTVAYAEGLMLALAAGCLLALMHRRWVLAGVAAAAASVVRPNALVLVLCCAWAAIEAIRQRRQWSALAAPLLAPIGALAYFVVQGNRVGDFGFWFRVEDEGWNQRTDFGVNTFKKFFWLVDDYSGTTSQSVMIVGLILMVIGLVLLWRWKPPAILTIWTVGVLFLAVASESQGARPRYLLTAFPLIIAAARGIEGERFTWVLAVSASLLMLMAALVANPLVLEP